jgi:hypothetical protein
MKACQTIKMSQRELEDSYQWGQGVSRHDVPSGGSEVLISDVATKRNQAVKRATASFTYVAQA